MKILSMTATFGKLDRDTLTLHPGLNVMGAPNEWGKTTWCAFLIAMLYGIDTSARASRGTLPDKTHYAPWSGKPMSGRMDLEWQGRAITIERSTKGRVPMGQFSAYETETGIPVPELTAENCGEVLLGAERSVFTRSGFLKFTDLPVTADEHLTARLNALVTTGDESGAGDLLMKKLNDLKNSCQYRKKGKLPDAIRQQEELEQKLEALTDLQNKARELEAQADTLRTRKKALSNHLTALAYEDTRQQARAEAQARSRYEEKCSQLRELEQQCRSLPGQAVLEQELARLHALQEARLQLSVPEAPPAVPDTPAAFRGWEPESAAAQAQADTARWQALQTPHKRTASLLPIGGLVLMAVGAVLLVLKLWIPGSVLCVLGAAIATVGFGTASKARTEDAARKTELQMLQNRYAPLPADRWVSEARNYARQELAYRSAMKLYEQGLLAHRQQALELQQQLDAATGGCSLMEREQALNAGLRAYRELETARREALACEESLKALGSAIRDIRPPEPGDSLLFSEPETRKALNDADLRLQLLLSQAGTLQGQAAALGHRAQLEQTLAETRQRIGKLLDYQEAIGLAMAKLEDASQELQRRFAPQITRNARELFTTLTGGRYTRLNLGADFSAQVAADGDVTLHSVHYPSDGTVDQLYLAIRLAVARVLMPEAPLILDDALIRFDDRRLGLAMDVLRQEAETRQVIVFTCQGRELEK